MPARGNERGRSAVRPLYIRFHRHTEGRGAHHRRLSRPELLDTAGDVLDGVADGHLVIADSWPGQMRTLYREHERFEPE